MTIPLAGIHLGSLDPTWATFLLGIAVLGAGVYLVKLAVDSKDKDVAKMVFPAVGVLFGLLAAGGIGTLFVKQATESAEKEATNAAAEKVSGKVTDQVESALEAKPAPEGGSKPPNPSKP